MCTGIFYLSRKQSSDIRRSPFKLSSGQTMWIRVEEVDMDLEEALSMAKPASDEILMNTHELP